MCSSAKVLLVAGFFLEGNLRVIMVVQSFEQCLPGQCSYPLDVTSRHNRTQPRAEISTMSREECKQGQDRDLPARHASLLYVCTYTVHGTQTVEIAGVDLHLHIRSRPASWVKNPGSRVPLPQPSSLDTEAYLCINHHPT